MPSDLSNMIFYSDYFAFVAEAGLNRARAIAPAITTTVFTDPSTITIPVNADVAVTNLSNILDSSYEWYWRDGQNLTPMRQAFIGLSDYIRKKSGLSINAYITQEGIQVEAIYAEIHNILDATSIDSGNIKS